MNTRIAIAIIALSATACSDNDNFISENKESSIKKEIQLTLPDYEVIDINDAYDYKESTTSRANILVSGTTAQSFAWASGDQISIFDSPLNNITYRVKSGYGTKSATYYGDPVSEDDYWAIYPYSSSYVYDEHSKIMRNVRIMDSYTSVAADASGIEGCQPGAFVTIGKCSNSVSTSFKAVCAVVRVQMPANIVEARIFSNCGEPLSGLVDIDLENSPEIMEVHDPYDHVSIKKGTSGETLTANKYYDFFVIPGTLLSGFTIALKYANGDIKYWHTTDNKEITLHAGKVVNVGTELTKTGNKISLIPGVVDLGDAGKFWACNLGAMCPIEVGYRYACGDYRARTTWDPQDYMYAKYPAGETWTGKPQKIYTKYVQHANWVAAGYSIDNRKSVERSDDPAWRLTSGAYGMPFDAQLHTMVKNTTCNYFLIDGKDGTEDRGAYTIISNKNNRRIAVPANINHKQVWFYTGDFYNTDATDGAFVMGIGAYLTTVYDPDTYGAFGTFCNRFTILPVRPIALK